MLNATPLEMKFLRIGLPEFDAMPLGIMQIEGTRTPDGGDVGYGKLSLGQLCVGIGDVFHR